MMIDTKILYKLPYKVTFLGVQEVENMDRQRVKALKISWPEKVDGVEHLRFAFFDCATGDYIGEA